jgi:hypothetical protein
MARPQSSYLIKSRQGEDLLSSAVFFPPFHIFLSAVVISLGEKAGFREKEV